MHLTHYWFIRATGPGPRDTYSPLRSLFSRSFFLSPSIPDLLLLCLASSAVLPPPFFLPSLPTTPSCIFSLSLATGTQTSSSRTFLVVEIIIALFSPYDDARSPDVNATATDRPYLRRPREVLVKREGERERPLARARRTYCYRNERPADKRSPWMTNERVPLA